MIRFRLMNLLFAARCTIILALFFAAFSVIGSQAQTVPTIQTQVPAADEVVAAPSPNDVREFQRLLGDPTIQNWLLQNAREAENQGLGEGQAGMAVRELVGALLSKVRTRVGHLREAGMNAKAAPEIIMASWQQQMSHTDTLRVLIYLVIFLFVGAGFEWLYAQYTHYRLLSLELRIPESLNQRLTTAFFRAAITFGGLFVFALGSIGTFLTFDWPHVVDNVVLDVLIIVLTVRLTMAVSRFFLAPRFKELRLVPFNSFQAKSLHRWIAIIAFIGVVNFAISDVFEQVVSMSENQMPRAAALSVEIFANLVWLLVVLAAIWKIRGLFVSKSNDELKTGKAGIWPVYLSALAIVIFVFWMIGTSSLMWSAAVLGSLFPFMTLCRHWVDNLFDQAEKVDQLHGATIQLETVEDPGSTQLTEEIVTEPVPASEAAGDVLEESPAAEIAPERRRYETYRPIAKRIVRFLLVIGAVVALVLAWDNNIMTLSSSPTVGGRLFEIAIDVVIALLIADLIWTWAKAAIDRRMADYTPPEDGHAPGPEARMATLLPLLRTILMVTLLTMAGLVVLSSFGVNIGPLLAGAGVIGVAVGFGAQALVRDVVSGIFFLIDDAFRIGEYVEIDNLRGTVEAMSIRSLRLRHHRGMVHTIPFGELKSLTNHSRDWVIMKLEFRVPFETDLFLVKKLIKKIGAEMLANEDYGHSIIEPPKSQGVRRMEEFNMVVGIKFMTKPGEQWIIRREAYQKVRDAFDANGIGFAERNVKVEVLTDQPLNEETEKAVVGAVQHAIEPPKGPPVPVPDEP